MNKCTFSGEQIIFLSITLLKLVASSLKEKKPTSLSNVADAFRRSSVLIETRV